jgi:putative ABC transport system ATP-binding protein
MNPIKTKDAEVIEDIANNDVKPDHVLLKGTGLKKYYQRGVETVKALDGIDVEIRKGEMVAVVGTSGAGKTTLVNILSCLDKPTAGKLFVKGEDVSDFSEDKLTEIRRENMGFVFQRFYLIPTLTVRENVEMPLVFFRNNKPDNQVERVLESVGLSDRANHLPRELSGGQMQRVAVARALIGNPSIILADEPTGNLDSKNTDDIINVFRTLSRDKNITVIISTHDMSIAEKCDRIIRVVDGKIDN